MKSKQRRPASFIPSRKMLQHCTNIEFVMEEAAELHEQKRCHRGREDDFTDHHSASASRCFLLATGYVFTLDGSLAASLALWRSACALK